MHIDDVRRIQAQKDHFMRHEGTHPANYSHEEKMHFGPKENDRRFKSKTEMLAEDMVKDAEKEGLHMEIE